MRWMSVFVADSLAHAFQNFFRTLVLISDFFHCASGSMPLLPASIYDDDEMLCSIFGQANTEIKEVRIR